MSPSCSEDLSEVIDQRDDEFIVLRSSDSAEDKPDYEEVASFSSLEAAEAFLGATSQL